MNEVVIWLFVAEWEIDQIRNAIVYVMLRHLLKAYFDQGDEAVQEMAERSIRILPDISDDEDLFDWVVAFAEIRFAYHKIDGYLCRRSARYRSIPDMKNRVYFIWRVYNRYWELEKMHPGDVFGNPQLADKKRRIIEFAYHECCD